MGGQFPGFLLLVLTLSCASLAASRCDSQLEKTEPNAKS